MLDPSASYAALGLSPDADRNAVDRAYRALMKRHHPDLGGDPAKAAEINRAYSDITRPAAVSAVPLPTDLASAIYHRRIAERREGGEKSGRKQSRWAVFLAIAAVVGAGAWIEREAVGDMLWNLGWNYFPSLMTDPQPEDSQVHVDPSDNVYSPVRPATITESVVRVRTMLAKPNGLELVADASQHCYQRLPSSPSFAAFDACLSLDDAVLMLAGVAAADRRGFGAVSLTARQLAAGRSMGGDFAGIESRLDRVRLMTLKAVDPSVDMPQLPPEEQPPVEPPSPPAEDESAIRL